MWSRATSCSSSSNSLHIHLCCLLLLLATAVPSSAAFENDFSDYPAGTQTCLDKASDDSGCHGDTSAAMNLCLCSNGGNFVTDSAKCIAQQDSGDLESTWEVMESHCSVSNTSLTIPLAQWMAQSSGVATSTPSAVSTATVTTTFTPASASPTSASNVEDDDEEKSQTRLSSSTRTAVIVGSTAAGLLLLATALFLGLRYRRRRSKYDQVHPLLFIDSGNIALPVSETAASSLPPNHSSIGPSELEGADGMAINTPSGAGPWHTPSDTSSSPWPPSALESSTFARPISLHQPSPPVDVYEMPVDEPHTSLSPFATTAPVEMPTTAVTSPTTTVSPTSRHSGVGWSSEAPEEPRRYEPFRPR